jgi:hypothetical protein
MADQHIAAETKLARDFYDVIGHRRKIVSSVCITLDQVRDEPPQ